MLHQGTAPQLADVADLFGSATSTYSDWTELVSGDSEVQQHHC
jgi:hypothetical protein